MTALRLSLILFVLMCASEVPGGESASEQLTAKDYHRISSVDSPEYIKAIGESRAVVIEKASSPVSSRTREFLVERNPKTARIWVFFTDKQVRSDSEFKTAGERVRLSDRSWKRRIKMDKSEPVFADLPVSTHYINQIVVLGAQHRRSSRWLNAASFDVRFDLIDQIAALPYVSQIKPVARRTAPSTKPVPVDAETRPTESSATAILDYGPSLNQAA
ncbi:MAG: hypothetical protein JSU65_02815, partial [Candidatus Zixiibacteriota bacterium]